MLRQICPTFNIYLRTRTANVSFKFEAEDFLFADIMQTDRRICLQAGVWPNGQVDKWACLNRLKICLANCMISDASFWDLQTF